MREGNSLLFKVGLIMMSLAFALLIAAAVVVRVTLDSEPERVVAAEVATKSPSEAPRNSSGEEGSATKKSSSEKESPRYPSEESLGYGSSSPSGWPVGQRKEEANEPQPVLHQEDAEPQNSDSPMPQPAGQQTPSEVQSEPEPQPQRYQSHQLEQPLPEAEQSEAPSGP